MRPIETDGESVTMINVFTPETLDDQERLVDPLTEFLEDHASEAPGFESAAVHRSKEGGHVANFARWESLEAIRRLRAENPDAAALVEDVTEIATSERHPYEVVTTVEATDGDGSGSTEGRADGGR